MSDVFQRLSSKESFTGMYAERFAHPGHEEEDHDYVLHNDALFRDALHQGRTRIGDVKRKHSTHHVLTTEESLHLRHRDNHPPPNDTEGKIRYVFDYYCTYALGATDGGITELGTLNYIRFCRETPGIMNGARKLNRTNLDLIYTKAKNKHDTKLKFANFLDALTAIAVHKYPNKDQKTAFTMLLAKSVLQNPVLTGKAIPKSATKKRNPKRTSPRRSPGGNLPDAFKRHEHGRSPPPPRREPPSSPEASSGRVEVARHVPLTDVRITKVPFGIGVRLGGRNENTLEIGLFVDLACKRSKQLFNTVFQEVRPRIASKNVAFVVYHFPKAWDGSSLAINEAALAVRQIAPEKYVAFCLKMFEHQEDFGAKAAYDKSRAQMHSEAAAVAHGLGIDTRTMLSRLNLDDAGKNAVDAAMRASCMYSTQNGIRATPTVTVNGLVDFYAFHDWSCGQWLSFLAGF